MSYIKQTFKDGDVLSASHLNYIEDGIGKLANNNTVDLVMFMGQSNMAGRGVASESIVCQSGHGYEFRAISDPTKLYDIVEPFGKNENNTGSGVNENTKTGSLVSAFCEKYYEITNIPIVAVSCSKGGTSMEFWDANGKATADAINRYNIAKNWLTTNGYQIRHSYMVWLQGESDGGLGVTTEQYMTQFKALIEKMVESGIEKCFVIRVGNALTNPTRHTKIIKAQTLLCKSYENAIMINTTMDKMGEDGLMKDEYHLTQAGYNLVGTDAAINMAFYVNNQKEPYMIDREYNTIYFPYNVSFQTNGGSSEVVVTPQFKSVEYLFNTTLENGVVYDEVGTLNDGNYLTVSEANEVAPETAIVFDNSQDWTFECIAKPSTSTGLVIVGANSTTGGFVQLPNPEGASTACLRFRDLNKTMSVEASYTGGYTEPKHFAIAYNANSKTFKMYIDYQEVTVVYSVGSANTFTSFNATRLFGGYTDNYDFIGDVYYIKFTAGSALSVNDMHRID